MLTLTPLLVSVCTIVLVLVLVLAVVLVPKVMGLLGNHCYLGAKARNCRHMRRVPFTYIYIWGYKSCI